MKKQLPFYNNRKFKIFIIVDIMINALWLILTSLFILSVMDVTIISEEINKQVVSCLSPESYWGASLILVFLYLVNVIKSCLSREKEKTRFLSKLIAQEFTIKDIKAELLSAENDKKKRRSLGGAYAVMKECSYLYNVTQDMLDPEGEKGTNSNSASAEPSNNSSSLPC